MAVESFPGIVCCNLDIAYLRTNYDLVLINCRVGIVAAKNLWLIHSTWRSACAEESVWIQPKLNSDGDLFYTVEAQGPVYYALSEERILSFNGCHLTAPGIFLPPVKSVLFQDCRVERGIMFPPSPDLSNCTVTLLGNTYVKGRCIGASVEDQRKT